MKTDTLTGSNLSHWAAIVYGCTEVEIFTDYSTGYEWKDGVSCIFPEESRERIFDYADPATFQPIAERERISCVDVGDGEGGVFWSASTICKVTRDNERYKRRINVIGDTMAEAMRRCYVKSYLGDDAKE